MDNNDNLGIVCDICGKMGAKICYVSRSYGNGRMN